MNITEGERLLLIQKKEEIRTITQEIIEIVNKESTTRQDITEVKKKFLHVLSLLHILASYGSPNRDLQSLMMNIIQIIGMELRVANSIVLKANIEITCIVVNSITFSFSPWPTLIKLSIPPLSAEVQK